MDEVWDTLVIGAGSAGMAAAIYAARFNLKVLVVGQEVGGLLNESHNVENYPGFKSISGLDLMMKFKEHSDNLAVPIRNEWIRSVRVEEGNSPKSRKFILVAEGNDGERTYEARTLIFATGAKHRHLNAPGEEKLAGKGVSYCATCDAAFYKDIPVAIVGGGDSAAIAGNLVRKFASKIYVLVRGNAMRAEPINRKRLEDDPKVNILYGTQIKEILGENEVEGIRLTQEYEGSHVIEVKGVFVEIGQEPQSDLAEGLGVALNDHKEIIIDPQSKTNIAGVYAAGDVGNREYKQAITGAAEGAIAAFGAYAFLQKIDEGEDVNIGY